MQRCYIPIPHVLTCANHSFLGPEEPTITIEEAEAEDNLDVNGERVKHENGESDFLQKGYHPLVIF